LALASLLGFTAPVACADDAAVKRPRSTKSMAPAAAPVKISQQEKMRLCAKQATGKKGAERKTFMKGVGRRRLSEEEGGALLCAALPRYEMLTPKSLPTLKVTAPARPPSSSMRNPDIIAPRPVKSDSVAPIVKSAIAVRTTA
jgi:hypothetical protein